jgi:hypothetical protein
MLSISYHYSTYFSSIFSLSFHYFLLYFPNLFTIFFCIFQIISLFNLSFHYFLLYFRNYFTIQLIFLPYFPMCSSYQKQALTVMISPLYTNCHDIINIVECGIKHHQLNPLFIKTYTYLPIYLPFYQNYRFYSIFASYFPILMSFQFPQSNLFYITA